MRLKNGILTKTYLKQINSTEVDFCEEGNVQDYMNKTDKYLVLFHKFRWNNTSGAGFYSFEELPNRCVPDYANSCKLVKTDGKRMLLNISHHDKPMGFNAYVYSLNKKEYEALKEAESYQELEDFIAKQFEPSFGFNS